MSEKEILVANRIISRTNANNKFKESKGKNPISMNGKRMQKVLYLCNLVWLAFENDNSLVENDFEAWTSGPVINELYKIFRIFQTGKMYPFYLEESISLTEMERILINAVVDNTIDISLDDIIEFERDSKGPWYQVCQDDPRYQIIPKYMIKEYAKKYKNDIINFAGLSNYYNELENYFKTSNEKLKILKK